MPILRERLDGVVLEDEAVVSGPGVRQIRTARADVAHEPVSGTLHLGVLRGTNAVHFGITDRDEHRVLIGRIRRRHGPGVDERKPLEGVAAPVLGVNRKRGDLVLAVAGEVEVRQAGDVAGAENHKTCHRLSRSSLGYVVCDSRTRSVNS